MVSTRLKNIGQIGSFPQIAMNNKMFETTTQWIVGRWKKWKMILFPKMGEVVRCWTWDIKTTTYIVLARPSAFTLCCCLQIDYTPWKMMVGRLLSYWEGLCSGAMWNFKVIEYETCLSSDAQCCNVLEQICNSTQTSQSKWSGYISWNFNPWRRNFGWTSVLLTSKNSPYS